jgi:hypothetical protein
MEVQQIPNDGAAGVIGGGLSHLLMQMQPFEHSFQIMLAGETGPAVAIDPGGHGGQRVGQGVGSFKHVLVFRQVKVRKWFFFEKKNQKTFALFCSQKRRLFPIKLK